MFAQSRNLGIPGGYTGEDVQFVLAKPIPEDIPGATSVRMYRGSVLSDSWGIPGVYRVCGQRALCSAPEPQEERVLVERHMFNVWLPRTSSAMGAKVL